jgi:hypothetical protein
MEQAMMIAGGINGDTTLVSATVAPFLPTPRVKIIINELIILVMLKNITPLAIKNLKGIPTTGNYKQITIIMTNNCIIPEIPTY